MNSNRSRRSVRPWYVILLAGTAAAVIVIGVTELGTPASSARTSKETVTAASGVVQNTVSGSGNVEPGVDDAVNFATSGTLQTINVKVGQHVTKGQLIATLDPTMAEATLQQAEDSLIVAQDDLTELENGTSSSGSSSTGSSGSSGTTASVARASNATGSVASVRRPKTTTDKRSKKAVAPSIGSSSKTTGSGATTSTTQKSTPSASQIEQAKIQIAQAQQTVTNDQKAVDETRLYAPVNGMVASLSSDAIGQTVSSSGSSSNSSSSSSASSAGSSALGSAGSLSSTSSSSGFAQVINSNTMTMTVSLSESDISSVKVGQLATVSITALSGVELGGHVTAISPLGSDSSGVVTYNATVTVDQSNPKVLPGMSATATIVTSQAQGVTVPNQALTGDTVDLVSGGKVAPKTVVVGLRGSSRSQIISGLKAGQQVQITITLPALGTSSSTSSSSSSSSSPFGGGFGGGGFGGGRGALRAFFGGGGG